MNMKTPPPGKLSELIELAIADARRIDRRDYTPAAHAWHDPVPGDPCEICLAGAVIAATLGCPKDTQIEISCVASEAPGTATVTDTAWQKALWALNDARGGNWPAALRSLGQTPLDEADRKKINRIPGPVRANFRNWTQFDAHLDSLADCAKQLREIGL